MYLKLVIILTEQLYLHNNRKLTFSSWLTPAALVRVTTPWSTKIHLHIRIL